MIATSPASDNSAARVESFLNIVDRLADSLGLSVPPIFCLEELRSLPSDTLGRSLVDFLECHQLKPLDGGLRRKQLHDSVHVLTGYGVDSLGEAEVQAFLIGTKFNPGNLLIGLGLVRMIRRQRGQGVLTESPAIVRERLHAAYRRGIRSSFDPDRWQPELEWMLPLIEVRKAYDL
ncbi:MAG: hypothetical protein AAGA60_19270 [Cyanobacteria bacterium P01_E01_bin.42]